MSNFNKVNISSIEEAIKQLEDLKLDRLSFVVGDKKHDEIYLKDIEAIEIVLGNLEALCDMQKSADKELENAKKINEEHKKENGELGAKVKELEEYIFVAPNLDEMTAIKYTNIQREAYFRGRAEEQQKAEQIIYENYISKQVIKNYLKEEKERFEIYKKESETNENLKLGMYKHLGAKNMCEKILGIEKIVTLG